MKPDLITQKLLRLPAPTLLLGVRSLGVTLRDEGGQLGYEVQRKGILNQDLLDLLKARKVDLLDAIKTEPYGPHKPPTLGQTWEDFWREQGVEEDNEPKTWRDRPITDKQRQTLLKGNVYDIPATRGEASDRIKELIESGALCDFLSLAELESFDHRAPGSRGRRRRFCCPLCGDGKRMDASHRSLSVDSSTGGYFCFRCETKGKLREYLSNDAGPTRTFIHTPPIKEPADDKWKRWIALAQPIRETEGAKYLEGRGVPLNVAEAAGVKFGTWWRAGERRAEPFDAVIFPIRDARGDLVAAQARAIDGDEKRTKGEKSEGVFFTTPGRSQRLAITEAPIDALVLAACGLPAIALIGTSWPEWLPGKLAGRNIALATDADDAGDKCGRELGAMLCAWRLRPEGAKDWAELAERRGLGAVRQQIEAAEISLEEAAWGNAA